jgi:hypothetical protein
MEAGWLISEAVIHSHSGTTSDFSQIMWVFLKFPNSSRENTVSMHELRCKVLCKPEHQIWYHGALGEMGEMW